MSESTGSKSFMVMRKRSLDKFLTRFMQDYPDGSGLLDDGWYDAIVLMVWLNDSPHWMGTWIKREEMEETVNDHPHKYERESSNPGAPFRLKLAWRPNQQPSVAESEAAAAKLPWPGWSPEVIKHCKKK